MSRLQAMQVFVRVAETGGFAEAARQLNMSPPAVTRAVAAKAQRTLPPVEAVSAIGSLLPTPATV